MGYGSRALELLKQYYEMKILNISEAPLETCNTEISKVEDEKVNLLEEQIGNYIFYTIFQTSDFILIIRTFQNLEPLFHRFF